MATAAATRSLAWRGFADGRGRNIAFALLFALYGYANAAAYESTYPTVADRKQFAASFGDNPAVRLFYGVPHDLLNAGGYTEWRVGGILAIFAAVFGLLAAAKAIRAPEDSGAQELVLSGAFGRGSAFAAALGAIAAGAALLFVATFVGLAPAGLDAGPSALLALDLALVALLFGAGGAVTCQLGSTRRVALEYGAIALVVAFVMRVVADTSSSLDGLRWATPLGWAEEVRPFTGAQPEVLLLLVAATAVLLAAARWIWLRRDVGEGILPSHEVREPRLGLLSSPTAQALRSERVSLAIWIVATGAFSAITGLLAESVSDVNISKSVEQQLEKLGSASVTTPSGYLAFSFLFFILVVGLFMCAQMGAARHEEADGRLETLFAQPAGRRAWFAGRLALAVAGAVAISLAAGILAWAGAAAAGADVGFGDMVAAGANCLPSALLFGAIAALALAVVPRAAAGIAYAVVILAFMWELFGTLLDVPSWTLELSPFHHIGLVPAESFETTAAIVMVGTGAVLSIAAVRIFERRDLTGA